MYINVSAKKPHNRSGVLSHPSWQIYCSSPRVCCPMGMAKWATSNIQGWSQTECSQKSMLTSIYTVYDKDCGCQVLCKLP